MASRRQRWLSLAMVWTAFYEQLAWTTVLVVLARGDRTAVALGATAYSFANMGGNILFGLYADRFQRDRVAGIGLVAMATTALLHLVAGTAVALVTVRLLHGFAASALAPAALARVSEASPEGRQGESFARAGLIIALASMVSPPVTGALARSFGVPVAIGLLAALLVCVAIAVLTMGGESPSGPRRPVQVACGLDRIQVAPLLMTAAVAFAIMFGQNVLFYAFQLKTAGLGMGPAETGRLLSAFAVGAILAFIPPLSRAVDRWGAGWPLPAGMLLSGLGLWGLAGAAAQPAMAGWLFVYGLGFGMAFTAVSALGAAAAGRSRRSLAFGLLTAAFSAGAILGPLVTRAADLRYSPFTVSAAVAVGAALLFTLGRARAAGVERAD